MKKLSVVLSLIFCVSFLYISNKNVAYAKNDSIDYDSVSDMGKYLQMYLNQGSNVNKLQFESEVRNERKIKTAHTE